MKRGSDGIEILKIRKKDFHFWNVVLMVWIDLNFQIFKNQYCHYHVSELKVKILYFDIWNFKSQYRHYHVSEINVKIYYNLYLNFPISISSLLRFKY